MVTEAIVQELVLPAVLGLVGGATRGVVGMIKALSLKRRIIWEYYLVTLLVAMIIGLFTGIIFSFDYRLSLLAGYAGTDILEAVYKTFKTEKVYVKPK